MSLCHAAFSARVPTRSGRMFGVVQRSVRAQLRWLSFALRALTLVHMRHRRSFFAWLRLAGIQLYYDRLAAAGHRRRPVVVSYPVARWLDDERWE